MLYYFKHRWSFFRVKYQATTYQVKSICRARSEPIFSVNWLYLCQEIQHLFTKICFQRLNVTQRRWPSPLNYSFNLIKSRVTWKHRFTSNHFSNHASEAPYIGCFGIFFRSQQNLWCSIPPGGNILS